MSQFTEKLSVIIKKFKFYAYSVMRASVICWNVMYRGYVTRKHVVWATGWRCATFFNKPLTFPEVFLLWKYAHRHNTQVGTDVLDVGNVDLRRQEAC